MAAEIHSGRQGATMNTYTASDLMTSRLMTVPANLGLRDLTDFLRDNAIHGALVKEGDRLVGVVSYTDLMVYLSDEFVDTEHNFSRTFVPSPEEENYQEFVNLLDGATVNDIMTPAVFTCDKQQTAGQVAELMMEKEIHRVVVTEDGAAIGLLSATDLLKAVSAYEVALTAPASAG